MLVHRPPGQRIPDKLHAVSFSLPTMRDVIGYEEKDPEVLRHMSSGYPRFVQHPLLKQAAIHVAAALHLTGQQIWLTSSHRAASELRDWLANPPLGSASVAPFTPVSVPAEIVAHGGLTGVAFPENPATYARAKTFLQHTGAQLSSREAEDYLVRVGQLPSAQPEPGFDGYAPGRVKGSVARAFDQDWTDDVFLANSGMNAIYATFRTVESMQRPYGRTRWIQLGWLYLDTAAILQKLTRKPADDHIFLPDVNDLAALRDVFARHGNEIAGVITEAPTNPLVQTPDLAEVAALCRRHEAVFVVDPTIACPLNINVFPYADVAVNSLTKYAASEGDVIAGAVVLNPHSPWANGLRSKLPAALEPVYSRDLVRLASQISEAPALIAQINRTVPKVIDFLQNHPAIGQVYWALQSGTRENYLAIARAPDAVGSMISFTLKDKPLAWFHDRVRLAKGPSFGMKTTLLSPFMYLAHYDLVKTEEGRAKMRAASMPPDILRLSIGSEPAEEIIAALAEALG